MGIIARKIQKFFIIFLLSAVLILGAGYFVQGWYKKYQADSYSVLTALVGEEIINCAELVSRKSIYTDIVSIRKKAIFGLSQSLMLVKYTGTICAGIEDLTQITFEISQDMTEISLKVPHAKILSNDITNQVLFDQVNNIFVPISTEDVFNEIDNARKLQEKTLIENGFLKDADSYTEQLLIRLFSAMQFVVVNIEFIE